ncbi:DNA adenine methylase [Candidatus Lucifugimonas marina]|uniref:Site-specific DNA-methyltransferase (adenine-specific) n=1 Tax=Candidatus Lucifugimonas marina TaxID=3038979 RepID=A0AAJ5ZD63_9CHLR|nr:Dam family site-specific DNA-(adenine-N6)-methyltransferase [SAR202 cluster bacterium JH639]WFG38800.1 Dam family site-specific DNA-(adenine-N6)-methyltransferase [SAR202 cluster bacterium JH1073]
MSTTPYPVDQITTVQDDTSSDSPTAIPPSGPIIEPTKSLANKPFLKWAGGKTRLLKRLLPLVPETFVNYHEPFVGGGAMYFALRTRVTERSFLSDLNEDLINVWLTMQKPNKEFENALSSLLERDSKEFYYEVRAQQPKSLAEQAARFVYLNQTSWNGLWRVNAKGEFNVPWGQRPFRSFSPDQLSLIRSSLVDTEIRNEDFRSSLSRARPGDFVYLDPPYLPLSDTSKFFFYTQKRFRQPDLEELANHCRWLSMRGVSWMLSNRDTPLVRTLFSESEIIGITTHRSVAAQNGVDRESRKSPEVIIRGGYA